MCVFVCSVIVFVEHKHGRAGSVQEIRSSKFVLVLNLIVSSHLCVCVLQEANVVDSYRAHALLHEMAQVFSKMTPESQAAVSDRHRHMLTNYYWGDGVCDGTHLFVGV